jgi:hypothetical protein
VFTATAVSTVHRPMDEVFDFVADARNRPRWDDSVDSEELTSPEPIGLGTTVRTTLRSMGRSYRYNWAVTEFEAPRRMTIESTSGPLPTTLAYRLTGGAGDTTVEFTVTGRPTGLMRLLQPLVARTAQTNLNRSFPRLQRLLDAGGASGGSGQGPASASRSGSQPE